MVGRTIALTGATGFVGSHLLTGLLSAGFSVVALHRRPTADGLRREAGLTWEPVTEAARVFKRQRIEAVCHLATSYGNGMALAEVVESNVVMPLRLLELAIEQSCALFVNTDTFFGKPEFNYPHMRPYIESKGQFIRWAGLAAASAPATKVVNARLEHVYGTGDGPQKFVSYVLGKLMANAPLALTPGDQRRDFVHVDDVVGAYLRILASADALPTALSEIQVGTGESHTVRTFVETARTACGSTSMLDFGAHPHRPQEIMHSQADITVLRALGWNPAHSLTSGIRAVLEEMSTRDQPPATAQ
jgi:nucleoside-diphosphate-sugar epimerase